MYDALATLILIVEPACHTFNCSLSLLCPQPLPTFLCMRSNARFSQSDPLRDMLQDDDGWSVISMQTQMAATEPAAGSLKTE